MCDCRPSCGETERPKARCRSDSACDRRNKKRLLIPLFASRSRSAGNGIQDHPNVHPSNRAGNESASCGVDISRTDQSRNMAHAQGPTVRPTRMPKEQICPQSFKVAHYPFCRTCASEVVKTIYVEQIELLLEIHERDLQVRADQGSERSGYIKPIHFQPMILAALLIGLFLSVVWLCRKNL